MWFWVKEAGPCPDPTLIQTSFHYCGHHSPVSSDLPRSATEGYLYCFNVTNKRDKKFTTLTPGAGDGARALLPGRHSLQPQHLIEFILLFLLLLGFFLFGLYLFCNRVSYSLGWPRTCHIAEGPIESLVLLPLPPKFEVINVPPPPYPAQVTILKYRSQGPGKWLSR